MFKQRIKNYFLKKIIKIVPEDIISDNKGTLIIGSEKISNQELQSLISEVKALESMRIWSIINETVKQRAYEVGWTKSTSIEELNTAKAMFYILDLQESIIKVIKSKTIN